MKSTLIDAVIFDLDGVITNSTPLHSNAWKKMFDQFLKQWSENNQIPFREFTHQEDYLGYVDGKPRYTGVKSFLESRGIDLPYGDPSDPPGQTTICALGNLKNQFYNELLTETGVEIYASSVEFIHQLKDAGISLGLATSSKNAARVLDLAGLKDLFETRVDGIVSAELGLDGKPSPDIFQTACDQLNAAYARSVVIEDAISGVQAGYRGDFGLVIGVAREDNREELELHGADLVVEDLSEISLDKINTWFSIESEKKSWFIEYHTYDPEMEGTRETLCAVGNGYFCTRGAMEELPANLDINYPGTYIAGLYNKLESQIAGRTVSNEDFVNAPNWLPITFKIGAGDWFEPGNGEIVEFHRKLDFDTGLLTRSMLIRDKDGKQTRIQSSRFASMADPHLAAQQYIITPINYAETIMVKVELDGTVNNQGVKRYRDLSSQHLQPIMEGGKEDKSYLEVQTNQSAIKVGMASKITVRRGKEPCSPDFQVSTVPGKVTTSFEIEARSDHPVTIEKVVSIYSSNLSQSQNPCADAQDHISKTGSFDEVFQLSTDEWQNLWEKMDLEISGDRLVQKMIRLHIFHTLTSVSPHTAKVDAGIPARGLHGEAYRGHIFWDELYIMPFFDLHLPQSARSALMYRYNRLPAAVQAAEEAGLRGAQFPWQSGSDGSEETQKMHLNPISGKWGPDYSHFQRHVSLAIAYNLWTYYWITLDKSFLIKHGAELFLSICLYWSTLAEKDPETGRYSIDQVMGPDEFHETYPGSEDPGLKDNAYSNLMAVWMFRKADQIIELMPDDEQERILKKLQIGPDEITRWRDISRNINLSISSDGILEQFAGYFDLEELDWEKYRSAYEDIHRMDRILKSEGLSPNAFKVAKQADTLMLFYNLPENELIELMRDLGYETPPDLLKKNLHYYLQRTSHGSTLSRLVHAYLAHITNQYDLSWKLYQEALRSDYLDIQGGTTREGIHLGVMTGTILFAYRAYAGLDWTGEILSLRPRLPTGWNKMSFNIDFQHINYHIQIHQDKIMLKIENAAQAELLVNNKLYRLKEGEWLEANYIRQ
jgi:beta-phosphoglucomutase family hydrolase